MVKRLFFIVALAATCVFAEALKPQESARNLAQRIMGKQKASLIVFKQLKSEKEAFELSSKDGKVMVSANSANAMAMGLGHYLKYYCNANVSWDEFDEIQLPETLPMVEGKVRREARVENRFFLNYCTFGYSMVWWQWKEWERFIDWMALNGINLPLAITGQESVWYKVWRELGLTDEEVRSYFTGPAHLPWHRMINLDRWQGPLPMSWLEHQAALQKQIVLRERELGMKPVLPAFAGHVPEALKRLYPKAKISRMTPWGGFRDEYRSFFLDPMDSLFAVIQKAFLKEQTRLYGTDNIYGVDPFNEVDPPSWEPEFLKRAGETIFATITECDPKASWLLMTWQFYADRRNWTNERIKAFLSAVPNHRLILLDYFAENTEVWPQTESYYGQDFVWCYLGNFGGNTMLAGNLRESGKRIENTIKNAGPNMQGIGSTLEGLDCNPMMYEYVLDKAWTPLMTDDEWVMFWATRRIGRDSKEYRQAWQLLLDSVYTRSAQLGQAPLTNARPALKGYSNWTTNPYFHYNNKVLGEVLALMEKASEGKTPTSALRFDLTNIKRQYLSNEFLSHRDALTRAYEAKDKATVESEGKRMMEILDELEQILNGHKFFSFDRWIEMAEKFGTTEEEKLYFRSNAATLLTTWGETPQSLNDYASRTWSGLVKAYYAPRWRMFIEDVKAALDSGRDFDQQAFNKKMADFERSVSEGRF